jgi:hypothetical protein
MVPLFAYYQQKTHNLMISCLPRRRPFHPVSGGFMVFAPVLRCWGFMYLSGRISREENLQIDAYITKRDDFFVPLFIVYHIFFSR